MSTTARPKAAKSTPAKKAAATQKATKTTAAAQPAVKPSARKAAAAEAEIAPTPKKAAAKKAAVPADAKPAKKAPAKKAAAVVETPAPEVAAKKTAAKKAVAAAAAPEPAPAAPVKKAAAKKSAKKATEPAAAEIAAPVAAPAAVVEAAPAKPAKKAKAAKAEAPAVLEIPAEAPAAPVKKAAKKAKPAAESADEPLEEPLRPTGPAPKLERLQKILAKAGIASRRKAEELIEGGQVQVNGAVVTELGTKADAGRDHIRVAGKLLQGAERIRYFVLNKPKGYVTTVSDPEGRPTVMSFFQQEGERLYPVGRLDYLSEGLLLVTNDGELANKLTRAASGVEKTYLVKVAGRPSEEALDALRQGVMIERGRHGTGTGRVRTAPAQIRLMRTGDNPWYEVILIEGLPVLH